MNANNSTNEQTDSGYSVAPMPQSIRFWLLVTFDIPAVACTFFLLYHLLFTRALRQALHNHIVIVLLFLALFSLLIDIPSYIVYLHLGYVWISSPIFCSFWSFVDIGLFNLVIVLMGWAAIERHVLVFHSRWVNTQRKRFLFHYLPLVLLILYTILFHLITICFPSCENIYDYSQGWCGYPCYYDDTTLFLYDNIVHSLVPVVLIIIFSITLVIRTIRQKQRVQQVIQWRKHRRMVVQLLLIVLLPVIFIVPLILISIAHSSGLPAEAGAEAQVYLYFLSYFVTLLLPYVCLASLPEVWKKLQIHVYLIEQIRTRFRQTNAVTP